MNYSSAIFETPETSMKDAQNAKVRRALRMVQVQPGDGALIGGFYLGIALGLLPVVGTPTGSASVTAAAVCVLACAVLVAAALWLERLCRVHDDANE